MIPTKRQMQIISKHFKEDTDALIRIAKRVGILEPHAFLQHAVDAGLNARGTEAMMFICGWRKRPKYTKQKGENR